MGSDLSAVVIGLAVMDVVLEVPEIPTPDNPSVQASRRTTHAGGKGLTQAVAARLLGMDVALITPRGSDQHALTLKRILDLHEINTEFIPTAQLADTQAVSPRTYVLRTSAEDFYIGFKNESELPLKVEFLRTSQVSGFIAGRDLVFVTFEVSEAALRQIVVDLTSHHSDSLLVITPSPTRTDMRIDSTILNRIDLLVGSDVEVARLTPRSSGFDSVTVLKRLINDGVSNAAALSTDGIVFLSRSSPEPIRVPYPDISDFDTAGARDAFAVCLAHQLRINNGTIREYDVRLASVAYGLAASKVGEAEAMPSKIEILDKAHHLNISEPE